MKKLQTFKNSLSKLGKNDKCSIYVYTQDTRTPITPWLKYPTSMVDMELLRDTHRQNLVRVWKGGLELHVRINLSKDPIKSSHNCWGMVGVASEVQLT